MTYDQQKYLEAKNDILKAAKSINDLTPQQRVQMAQELFGTEVVVNMCKMMRQCFEQNA
jgi:hypothetical protein